MYSMFLKDAASQLRNENLGERERLLMQESY